MLDKKSFLRMKKEFEDYDDSREALIKKSRDVLKLSKQVIYSIHREDIAGAGKLMNSIKKEKKAADKIASKHPGLYGVGAYRVAIGEYVEAALYYNYVKNNKIVTSSYLKVPTDHYLFGLIDLTGELGRKAVQSAGKGNYDMVFQIKEVVAKIYGELLKFDFRDSDMRRKFDSVKYDLKKLEDLCLDLKLKGKI